MSSVNGGRTGVTPCKGAAERSPRPASTSVVLQALPLVTLPEEAVPIAEQAGADRAASYPTDAGVRPETAARIHTLGVLGEMAVAEWYGLDWDRAVYDTGDGGVDLTIPSPAWGAPELTIDVKCRDYQGDDVWVLIPEWETINAQVVYGTQLVRERPEPQVRLLGWRGDKYIDSKPVVKDPWTAGTRFKNTRLARDELFLPHMTQAAAREHTAAATARAAQPAGYSP